MVIGSIVDDGEGKPSAETNSEKFIVLIGLSAEAPQKIGHLLRGQSFHKFFVVRVVVALAIVRQLVRSDHEPETHARPALRSTA